MSKNIDKNHITFKEVELGDRDVIRHYLSQERFMISDIAFGNLFIWRVARKIAFSVICGCLVIETTYAGQEPFVFFPVGGGDKAECLKLLKHYYDSKNLPLVFHSLEWHSVEFLQGVFSDIYNVEARLNRDRSDYIYLTWNLISLSGRKYHKKKNHLNRFFKEHVGFGFEMIGDSNLLELKEIWEEWSGNLDSNDVGLVNEARGIKEVFEHYDALGFRGGLLRFEGKIIAFSFGEILSSEICVIHIEKADASFHGAYQAINQQLLKHCFSDVKYVNREEDLGIEGLRKAKMSYNPEMILEKYEVRV